MTFDVSLISRISDEIENSGKRLREIVNSPDELTTELQKIESNINSLKSLTKGTEAAGANANTTQVSPNQNQN